MSLDRTRRIFLLAAFVLLCKGGAGSDALAQEAKPAFYAADADAPTKDTAFFGSLTSSSFYFSESAQASPIGVGDSITENGSPISRVFTELRLQLSADHISGGEWDFRADLRARTQIERCKPRLSGGVVLDGCLPTQSGTFGGDEREAKELYLRYRGADYDVVAGRQFVPELAAIKFDGVRIQQNSNEKWKLFGFGGLYPSRGSRDFESDYPTVLSVPADPTSEKSRIAPVVLGAGASYVRGKMYGALGVAGILPRAKVVATGLEERTRILMSSTGYWQQSDKTDIYHYVVLDGGGEFGAGISNFSLGLNHRASGSMHLFAHLNRVDTEVLTVQAQTRLDQVDALTPANIQNNWYVSRVAQESARLGASSSFSQRRYQLSVSGTLRRRPELVLRRNGDDADVAADTDDDLVLPLAQAADITLQLVDRKSFGRFRIGGSVTGSFGYKGENLDRSKSTSGRLQASRPLLGGKGEFELNLDYLQSEDETSEMACGLSSNDILSCYGASSSTILGAGGMLFYRPKKNWFAMGMLSVARQTLTTMDAGSATKEPDVTMLTAFARLAYRF